MTVTAWTSQDLAKIEALYATSTLGFDYTIGPLSSTRTGWDKAQEAYVTEKNGGIGGGAPFNNSGQPQKSKYKISIMSREPLD